MTNYTILVINQYYRPDVASSGQLLAELCEFLQSQNITVHVVTGQPSYTSEAPTVPEEEILNGVTVHRVSLGKSIGKKTLLTRIMGYSKFLFRSWMLAHKISRRTSPDAILTLSNPPFVGLVGGSLAKKHKIPFIYVLYDIHPDILVATRWMNIPRICIKAWDLINAFIFKAATTIIVPSSTMKKTLVTNKLLSEEKIEVIPNWARPEINKQPYSTPIKSSLGIPQEHAIVLYAGNIGIMQQLDPILDSALDLKESPIDFVFIGEGEKKSELMQRTYTEELTNVHFFSYQPEQQFSQIVQESDACLVTLQPGLDAFSAPSRAYTFLSAGTPIIALMPSDAELATLIMDQKCGWNVINSHQLSALLVHLADNRNEYSEKGGQAQKLYWDNYRESIVMNQYLTVIKKQISHIDSNV